ncbi:lysophospholipid acyltransferase family protein [Xanthomonas arboricola pv. juglandis]|uniref:1-acyl-sn-glycerol-3-phosphate acyltransferase n=3 Tax=Xanthomonas arboricola TaxID=56448 RepID=A0A9N8MJT9_XANCJ|nr:lysophospholipid acyltransferase family protein [Xanthomonas arboricola]KER81246.1 acetyltransferase [Xanthomonas arboricola pv. celebensis]MDN0220187.1 lysophospholipid acyltransferase family protein [Xanthomonas arboricola pv. juglandis]MDN0224588.1 lysophospholipid acyltransferase family protein [Xanthomonas arboricola pv. juglandis]MDN0228814.1 lysophospholipid acyltransferase family protein [Xanthomonas arboricola pv. juglandis]MDN0232009.1 lysophospholipid acyltransferase family prote
MEQRHPLRALRAGHAAVTIVALPSPGTGPVPSMSESSLDATRDAGSVLRWFRYLYRVPLLLMHLSICLPITMLCVVAPPLARIRTGRDDTLDELMIRWWQGNLMRIFGFRLRRFGTPLPGATLFVANHVSWVDISMLHSQRVMGFVAKREIAGWPLVGWLATKGQTIFHQRGNTESLGGVLQEMLLRLRSGKPVGVFPEGRTRGGTEVGPFHARIFQAAVEAGVPVQPVALRYGERGNAQAVVAFGERESFFANIVRLLGEPSRLAEVHFLEPIRALDIEGRRRLADTSRQRIIAAMES